MSSRGGVEGAGAAACDAAAAAAALPPPSPPAAAATSATAARGALVARLRLTRGGAAARSRWRPPLRRLPRLRRSPLAESRAAVASEPSPRRQQSVRRRTCSRTFTRSHTLRSSRAAATAAATAARCAPGRRAILDKDFSGAGGGGRLVQREGCGASETERLRGGVVIGGSARRCSEQWHRRAAERSFEATAASSAVGRALPRQPARQADRRRHLLRGADLHAAAAVVPRARALGAANCASATAASRSGRRLRTHLRDELPTPPQLDDDASAAAA